MEKDKIRSWRQSVSFALVSHLSSVNLESPCRHHPSSCLLGEGGRGTEDLGSQGDGAAVSEYSTIFLRGEVKNFRPG